MQNIDPVFFLQPIIVISFSVGLLVYWRFKRPVTKWVLVYSFVAYFGAIALKYAIQIPTIGSLVAAIGTGVRADFELGLYYGIQTCVLEVGGAYLVARYAFHRNRLTTKDAEAYGLSLALWENAIFIGLISWLVNYIIYYALLSSGPNSISDSLYNVLSNDLPYLFDPPTKALGVIGLNILDRVSSLLAHFSWGLLVVYAAALHRRAFLALALPMGLLDFAVPFEGVLGRVIFEAVVFVLALGFLAVAVTATKRARLQLPSSVNPGTTPN
jgi:hypothetical protein